MLADKEMAVRKKSEALNFRVSPMFKTYLEGAANAMGKTSTQLVEDAVIDIAEEIYIDPHILEISDQFLKGRPLSLRVALTVAYVPGEPILTKLRTAYIADIALSARDRIVAKTIFESPSYFAGETRIFSVSDGVIAEEYIANCPAVDLDEISKSMPLLEAYAAFKEKNSKIKVSYESFLEMTVEDD